MAIVVLAVIIAIVFAATYGACRGKATSPRCNVVTSVAGTAEWLCAFVLAYVCTPRHPVNPELTAEHVICSFYFLTFVLDLWPAAKTSPRHLRRIGAATAQRDGEKGLVQRTPSDGESTPRGTIDSAGVPDPRMAGEEGLRPMSERPRF